MPDCVICSNDSEPLLIKSDIQYYQCNWCRTVFCQELNQENLVGGEFEEARNKKENHLRIERINTMVGKIPKDNINILDFGCGHGMLIKDLKEAGYENTVGYDSYNEEFSELPERGKYDICISVECFEHFAPPFYEIDAIWRSLKDCGHVMVETGFVNIADFEGIDIKDYFYIEPKAGHSTIFSHHSLDLLMALKGFKPRKHFNKNVRLYEKFIK